MKTDTRFEADYARKLALIEQSIFGADIQPVAIQIAKLRFFISLICDQKTETTAENAGVLPLPNLETRIVAANTLLPIEGAVTGAVTQADLMDQQVDLLREELRRVRHDHFQARNPAKKKKCRDRDKELRDQIAATLKSNGLPAETATKLASWDPYDQNEAAPFFDPVWMFGTAYTRSATPAITLKGEFADIVNAAQTQQELASKYQTATPDPQSGFEIIIGNPPYIRHEKIKSQKEALKPHYQCYTGTADIYVYFYERALQLLRPGGILSYITSNSFLNSAFGEKLRGYLASQTTLLTLIDFAEAKIFTAITEPCILITRKGTSSKNSLIALKWDETQRPERIAEIVAKAGFLLSQVILANPPWQLETPSIRKLLDRLITAGKPLENVVNKQFYYGLKTGFNEAFLMDTHTRDALIAQDPGCQHLFFPFLAGRDLRRWHATNADRWMIVIPSSENVTHPWSNQNLESAEAIFKKNYPSIHERFDSMRDKLIARQDKGRYFWELRSCAYYEEFKKPKLIYQEINRTDSYAYDYDGFVLNNKLFMLPDAPIWLVGILNSPIAKFYLHRSTGVPVGGFLALQWPVFKSVPVCVPQNSDEAALNNLSVALHWLHSDKTIRASDFPRDPAMREFYERLLNGLVYELYLPDELHNAGLYLFDLVEATQLPDLGALPEKQSDPKQKLRLLREKFEELDDPRHPLRAALQKLSTLDSVRIIEGKA